MRFYSRAAVGSLLVTLVLAGVALAGMPMALPRDIPQWIGLSPSTRLRLDVISFFMLAFLLSAFAVQCLWNYLSRDFSRLPRLSYAKALGLTTLWGLLFLLVLTMISGARELMTPGAWKKDGSTYKLRELEAERPAAATAHAPQGEGAADEP